MIALTTMLTSHTGIQECSQKVHFLILKQKLTGMHEMEREKVRKRGKKKAQETRFPEQMSL